MHGACGELRSGTSATPTGERSVVRLGCQFQPRRGLHPGVVVASEIIATGKKLDHIFLVKRFIAGLGKVSRNAREVKVNSVALGDGIDAVEVSDPLILDKGGDRTLRNRQDVLADGLPFRIDLAVSDNEQTRRRGRSSGSLIVENKREYRWSDKDLSRDAAIDMELVVILSAHPHLNSDRRENPGKCRRGENILRNRAIASRLLLIAIRPMSHNTGLCVSRLVVPISRTRPFIRSLAISWRNASSTYFAISLANGASSANAAPSSKPGTL